MRATIRLRPGGREIMRGLGSRLVVRHPGVRGTSPRIRVVLFSTVLAALGILAIWLLRPSLRHTGAPIELPWPLFAALYALAEAWVIEVHFRRETHSLTLSEVPAVLGLFFVDPTAYVLGLVAGATIALLVARQPPGKIYFNLASVIVGATLSLAVFQALAFADGPPGADEWLAAFGAMIARSIAECLAVATVITLSGGAPQFQRLPQMLQVGAMFAVTNTALALLVVDILWVDPVAVWLVGVPLVTLFVAYRAYLSERQKHESLELLYESSRIFHRSPEIESAIVALLEHARIMFHSDRAELVVRTEDGTPLRTSVGPGDRTEVMAPAPDRVEILERLARSPKPFTYVPGPDLPSVGDRLFRFALVSPLQGESSVLGAMLVADRSGGADEYSIEEIQMFETVANQAAVALENGQLEQSLTELSRLKDELKHQAYHDPLTGLPNRSLFTQALEAELARDRDDRPPPIVLFLDLDDFKVVNDTVGHVFGDRLLQGVAERIRGSVRSGDVAARFGGDEFAILLGRGADEGYAKQIADRIAASLRLPFRLAGREFSLTTSIGITAAREGEAPNDILRDADVAMYAAKARGKGQLAVWDPLMHRGVVERHELMSDLSTALLRGEIEVHYQPLVALDGRGVLGFEALARWTHPERGQLSPEIFVPLAEESGSVVALGRHVLRTACEQLAAWQGAGVLVGMTMSVNLSPHEVHRPDFIDGVLTTLEETGVDPRQLVLEMTETAMFRDIDATSAKLQALRQHGVRIAVDDFGTGYSSLRWLRQFPVDILKVAKEFVVEGAEPGDWAFAHAIVALGKTLGLSIVAEGIEQPSQRDRLRLMGCDYGQGFLFARAVPADEVAEVVARVGGPAKRPSKRVGAQRPERRRRLAAVVPQASAEA